LICFSFFSFEETDIDVKEKECIEEAKIGSKDTRSISRFFLYFFLYLHVLFFFFSRQYFRSLAALLFEPSSESCVETWESKANL
jgi:hypothetical protein